MVKLNVDIDERLDKDFRDTKNQAKGHRSPLSDAVEEALILWVNQQKAKLQEEEVAK